MIVLKETVQEIVVRKYVEDAPAPAKCLSLLSEASEAQLMGYGVPEEWLELVRQATEDTVLDLVTNLPEEAREAVLSLATGVRPEKATVTAPSSPSPAAAEVEARAFAHPDAQRRFRTVADLDELQRALDAPWEKWTVFLHPAQRALVERDFNGPAKVAGSAGTGKTIAALHRAVYLAEVHPSSRVLLTTFSDVLANALRAKLRLLIGSRPRLGEQIEVLPMGDVGLKLYRSTRSATQGEPKIAEGKAIRALIQATLAQAGQKFSMPFLLSEWVQVVDAWQLKSWEEYRDVSRLGRRTRLREPQRQVLWSIFAEVLEKLRDRELLTESQVFTRLAKHYAEGAAPPFDYVVVDEAQDVSVAQLRCLAALAGDRPNGLFFAGDTGQRIFQQPFSWKSLGVDLRGRSSTLKVNYRTSHQIRSHADRLLDPEIRDVDGTVEDRRGTISVFNGPAPKIVLKDSPNSEQSAVAAWLRDRIAEGLRADEIVVFVRSANEIPRAEQAAIAAAIPYKPLGKYMETSVGIPPLCAMHLAKGLEFRAVVVMACDDEVVPLQGRLETASDAAELEEIYNTERQLLYVAATRARDHLLLSSGGVPSEFLRDLASDL